MKINLHTHTLRCGHGHSTDEEMVLAAIENGYTKLGFSDHTPFPYDNGYINPTKMGMDELDGYIASVLSLKEKYKDQIEILLGLECEWVPRFLPFLRETRAQMDYLIFGNHGDGSVGEPYAGELKTPEELEAYTQTAVDAMESGLFLYMAHPDLMLYKYPGMDDAAEAICRQLCREANRLHVPLEYNTLGFFKKPKGGTLGYPCNAFWEIAAEENIRAVVGIDAHAAKHFAVSDFDGARNKLLGMGITVLDDPTLI